MKFPDYNQTRVVYHIAPITDLNKIINKGIEYDDKKTYKSKYLRFHKYIDSHRDEEIPPWVVREKAIFASMNFSNEHCWHSHSILLSLKVDPKKCWIANENLANKVYEPFILKDIRGFEEAGDYFDDEGTRLIKEYWETSLSFLDNLKVKRDLTENYDAEVLIFHKIEPENISLLSIVSDHLMMPVENWKKLFKRSKTEK